MFQIFLDEDPAVYNGAFNLGSKCFLRRNWEGRNETLAKWN
jgi:hypothetical protein